MHSALQAIAIDIGPEIILGIIGGLGAIISSLLIYIFNQLKEKIEHIDKGLFELSRKFDKMSSENDSDHAIVISRLDKIEVSLENEKSEVEYIYDKLEKYDSLIAKLK